MQSVLLTVHLIACIALVVAVMLQRSEGGALGMGGGGTGGLISGRGAAGVLVKVTMGLAAIFFVTSVSMTYLNNQANTGASALESQGGEANPFDTLSTTPATPAPAPATTAPDPLSGTTPATTPSTTPPAVTPPAATTTPAAPAPSTATPDPLAPATTAPTTPAPAPENGGSPN